MLKCPECGRVGGPFHLRHQIVADGQILRAWACPCGETLHALGGAERGQTAQPLYSGFTFAWKEQTLLIGLEQIARNETTWRMGQWRILVEGPASGPGTRTISLSRDSEPPAGEWRLEPGWGTGEIARRIRAKLPAADLDPEMLAGIFVRLLA